MDIQTIAAATTAFQQIIGFFQSYVHSSKEAAVIDKAVELQDIILSLQSYVFSVQAKNLELLESLKEWKEKALAKADWAREKANYLLKEIAPGVFVYVSKEQADPTQSKPWHCTNCFKNQKLSILHLTRNVVAGRFYACPECKNEYKVPPSNQPSWE